VQPKCTFVAANVIVATFSIPTAVPRQRVAAGKFARLRGLKGLHLTQLENLTGPPSHGSMLDGGRYMALG